MPEYRSPDEQRAHAEQDARIRSVLEQAVHDGASCVLAMHLGEPPEVVERWVDAIWDGLRDGLSDERPDHAGLLQEDRLAAIVMLLQQRMDGEAQAILNGVPNAR